MFTTSLLEALSTHLQNIGAPGLQEPLLASPDLSVQTAPLKRMFLLSLTSHLIQETAVALMHCCS